MKTISATISTASATNANAAKAAPNAITASVRDVKIAAKSNSRGPSASSSNAKNREVST